MYFDIKIIVIKLLFLMIDAYCLLMIFPLQSLNMISCLSLVSDFNSNLQSIFCLRNFPFFANLTMFYSFNLYVNIPQIL
jgi:hypothetical protein